MCRACVRGLGREGLDALGIVEISLQEEQAALQSAGRKKEGRGASIDVLHAPHPSSL